MLMPKKNRIAIYELLFKEGVMVAKKDVHMPKHPELVDKNVPNLHVMKAMQSLKSRGYVKEQFAWRHFYWYLTNEGIQYLRDYLHLPPEIVPATLRRSRPETGRPRPKVCYRRERENYCSHGWQNSIARSLGVWKVNALLVLLGEKLTGILTDAVPFHLVLTRRLRLVLEQLLNSSLEVDLVVDVVSLLSRTSAYVLCVIK
ncbi:40S ribosomal protein S10 isoform X1 [Apteryx rowi]|uniref:40S ribosomal protein S10 isoform X1 n=1 Tax=Apteryx rowi TaxID=308060 RepID=UPI000E1D3097|nr:40S ribosomal protein S10 isoform X1 [Apteryx rowi]